MQLTSSSIPLSLTGTNENGGEIASAKLPLNRAAYRRVFRPGSLSGSSRYYTVGATLTIPG
ncbi:MAG: hypothetical protein LBL24_06520 [Bacteroidales bacterium]|nr:hypothetical protein [Bacteroidales bacterium]